MLKPGIPHPVHFEGQPRINASGLGFVRRRERELKDALSHSCLLLSAIRLEPAQTPFASAVTQLELNLYELGAQRIQLFDDGPEHVVQEGEQGLQAAPLLKAPSGHGFPVDVTDFGAMHFVLSLAFWVKPDWQVMQVPVPSAHWVQPS